ncbi:MAG: cell division protein ZapB [Desulfobacterales bacterium]|uniref:Cell division protein ZapB n=1 Tax=Candidatus Desulfatibia vada TaxID=2841696 RepID=A0A8J6P0G1_9BACT|nr:cell division protein ZapB [Candidatus Desulfatibia vada]MBL6971361.1 cell division protein ZapB [Desulfobacterales bacterium]
MDHEKVLRQFDEIEQKVGKLIDVCKSLEATNLEFKTKIERLEEELQGKVEAENDYQEEKALIRSKVDSLLARLEGLTETE